MAIDVSYRIVDMFVNYNNVRKSFPFLYLFIHFQFLGIFDIMATVNDARVFRQHGINNKLISRVTHADGEN